MWSQTTSQASTDVIQQVCDARWKIVACFPQGGVSSELKQLTGVEAYQCRKARIQCSHIACALLVWVRLKTIPYQTHQTIYQVKHRMLSSYLIEQLKRPSILMVLAQVLVFI